MLALMATLATSLRMKKHPSPQVPESMTLEDAVNKFGMESSGPMVDPYIQHALQNATVQAKLHDLRENPEKLMKAVRESPLIQQMAALNPTMANLVKNTTALQQIFSPEMVSKMSDAANLATASGQKDLMDASEAIVGSEAPVLDSLKNGIAMGSEATMQTYLAMVGNHI